MNADGIRRAIIAARKAKGLSRFHLAYLAGVSTGTLDKFEQGKRPCTLATLCQLAHVVGLAVTLIPESHD